MRRLLPLALPVVLAPLLAVAACGSKSGSTGSSSSSGPTTSSSGSSSAATSGSSGASTSSSSSSGAGGSGGSTASSSSSSGSGAGGSTSDAGTGGSTSDAGGSLSCGTYAYCDGFEAYSGTIANGMKLGPWLASVADVTVTVDTVKPHSGAKSLHIIAAASTSAHATLEQTTKPKALIANNNLFGRAMVFYSNTGGNNLPLGVHSWLFSASGEATIADGGVNMNMGGGGGAMLSKPQINYHFVDGGEASVDTGTWTAGVWQCVQWQYDGAGSPPADDAKLWIDGTLQAEAPATKGWDFATPWDTFYFGFTHYQTLTNTVEIFLDDFAMDSAMVPCPP